MFMFGSLWYQAQKAVERAESPAEAVEIFIVVAVVVVAVLCVKYKWWK